MALFKALNSWPMATAVWSRCISTTPSLYAEPLKKKKKIDPQVLKQREERRKKKLEKQIKRLERNARQLKPIEELEIPLPLLDEKDKRARNLPALSPQVLEERAQLFKEWSRFKYHEKMSDFQAIDRIIEAQSKALAELQLCSEDLYQEAIQPDLTLLPITLKGPVATPPIEGYISPDGDYIKQVKKWE